MARTKIDYGIDLGTTNSGISRMENGEAKIIKINGQDDTMPSCIAYNKKGVLAGKKAFAVYRSDQEASLSKDIEPNAFIEFKRTMGTDKKYFSSNIAKDLSSEELSAEVLKTLKSFVTDENVNAVVITVPAAFKNNQIDATRRAAKLAGFEHTEVLQEPVAAAMAYGLDSKKKDGFWLVFDFGGGTFDAALLKVEDGIMKVADTEGDNYLGGKNLDLAVVDEIIIPHIQKNYTIDNILSDDNKKANYRDALKPFAEELKNELSFNTEFNLYKEEGSGTDDDGEEIEIDLTVSQSELEKVLSPVFQKALEISKRLLERNNLQGSSLDSLILVGGPTFSPVLRKMLEDQICKPDTTVDPMTVVSKGAALYASTVTVSEEVAEQTRDRSKIQIEIGHESTTVEMEEFVTLKILVEKTEGIIPEKVFAEITRSDKAWASGQIEINEIGEVIEANLLEGKTNGFEVTLYDNNGNIIESEPKTFTIIQGLGGIGSMQTLPYNFGIELKQRTTGKIVFSQVQGLEKNKSLPVTGTKNNLKTQKQIRPGMESDFIKIPLYQGEHKSEGTRAIYNEHVYDIIISGNDLPALLPENSDVDLTVNIDKSQEVTIQAFFPYLDHTEEIKVPTDKVQSTATTWLANELRKAKGTIEELKEDNVTTDKVQKLENEILELEKKFENNKNDVDGKQEVLTNLRKTLKKIDELSETTEWPKLEEELKEEFYRLEKANADFGNDQTTEIVNQVRTQLDEVLKSQDPKLGAALLDEINSIFIKITLIYQLINIIRGHNQQFDSYSWKNTHRARQLINEGLQVIGNNPTTDELHPIVMELFDLLPDEQKPSGDDTVLVG
ncbi:Hsp70 family protein [Chryseobacterium gotjawalense]|uniref:Hsp70 family protein n=1 Tax=Chryseobacterium gotjawalense TaxID=3042315 RepID=A0ABY8REV3_9FLAO|nr:Hsp70 family protein [Chryseobacterium sp. wdc7]WHF51777.1 Hsp70 family protein [Chryseobacterium sp. wdc7]